MLSFLLFPPSSTTTLDLLSLHDALPISFFVADPVTMLPYESSLRRGPACPGSPGGRGIDYGDEGNPSWSPRSEEHTSELQSRQYLVCRLLLEKKKSRSSAEACPTRLPGS